MQVPRDISTAENPNLLDRLKYKDNNIQIEENLLLKEKYNYLINMNPLSTSTSGLLST